MCHDFRMYHCDTVKVVNYSPSLDIEFIEETVNTENQ